MKFIKEFNKFENNVSDYKETIEDIFISIKDFGLKISSIYEDDQISIGDKDIITNHNDFIYNDRYESLSINIKESAEEGDNFNINNDDILDELNRTIGHVESELGLKLNNIYSRTYKSHTFFPFWAKNIESLKKYFKDSDLTTMDVRFMSLNFEYLNPDNVEDSNN